MQPFNINEDLCEHQPKQSDHFKNYLQKCFKIFKDDWGVEIVYFIFSILCLVVIALILASYDGKASSERPSVITVNALVATSFTLTKGMMIACVSECIGQHRFLAGRSQQQSSLLIDVETYDAASRSIIGAFWLLLKPKVARTSVLGACIIVAALAIDPFAQQLVNFPTREVEVSSSSYAILDIMMRLGEISLDSGKCDPLHSLTFLRLSKVYYSAEDDPNVMKPNHVGFELSRTLFSAVRGFELEQEMERGLYSCPSDRCIWPAYLTLGICSKCRNLSRDLEFEFDNSTFQSSNQPDRAHRGVLPNGHSLTAIGRKVNTMAMNITTSQFEFNPTSGFAEGPLLEFSTISYVRSKSKEDYRKSKEDYPSWQGLYFGRKSASAPKMKGIYASWQAYNCALNLCIQHRKASVNNGQLEDDIKSKEKVLTDCNYHQEMTSPELKVCIAKPSSVPSEFKWETLRWGHVDVWLWGSALPIPIPNSNEWDWKTVVSDKNESKSAKDCFLVDPESFTTLRNYLKSHFSLSIDYDSKKDWRVQPPSSYELGKLFYKTRFDIPRATRSIAEDMTSALRRGQKQYPSISYGIAYRQETYVKVVWTWLLLPITLLCCTFLFLLLTIRKTKRTNTRPWKSSSLPLLLDGLEFSNETDYLVDVSESEARAKKTPLVLHRLWRVIYGQKG